MITVALRAIIGREPWLRPGGAPGTYVCRVPELAPRLASEPWIASAEVSNGFLTVTVTHDALAKIATEITQLGGPCAESDLLRGHVIKASTSDWMLAGDWEQARAALAVELTGRLSAAAGATVTGTGTTGRSAISGGEAGATEIAAGAGADVSRRAGAGSGGDRAASAGQSRLCCSVRACRRRCRAALGGYPTG